MLVIRRRAGDSLLIGDDVEIEILTLTPTQVKLGIRAPKSVSILRKEIRETQLQNLEAAKLPSLDAVSSLVASLRRKEPH